MSSRLAGRSSQHCVVLVLAFMEAALSVPLQAFEGVEHYRISQAAVRIAFEYAAAAAAGKFEELEPTDYCGSGVLVNNPELLARERTMFELLRNDSPSSFQFGDFVVHVDSVDDPLRLVRPDPSVEIGYSPRDENDLDGDYLKRVPTRLSGKLQALHSNNGHFQDHLLFSFWEWQRQAMREAFLAGRDANGFSDEGSLKVLAFVATQTETKRKLEEIEARAGDVGQDLENVRDAAADRPDLQAISKELRRLGRKVGGVRVSDLVAPTIAGGSAESVVHGTPAFAGEVMSKPSDGADRGSSNGNSAPANSTANSAPPGVDYKLLKERAEQTKKKLDELRSRFKSLSEEVDDIGSEKAEKLYASIDTLGRSVQAVVEDTKEVSKAVAEQRHEWFQAVAALLGLPPETPDEAVEDRLKARVGSIKHQRESRGSRPVRSLYYALVESAVAVHYLEDIFAPGHIATLRDASADYAANTLHDRYNATGACFRLRREALEESDVRGIYRAVREFSEPAALDSFVRELGFPDVASLDFALADIFDETPTVGNLRCGGDELFLRGDGDLLEPSATGVRASHRVSEGDCATPNCELESRTQRLFVTLVVAQAVVDVLRSYSSGYANALECTSAEGLFSPYRWNRMSLVSRGMFNRNRVNMPRAAFTLGEYSEVGPVVPRYGFMGIVDVGLSTFLEGNSEGGRGTASLEWIPIWGPAGQERESVYVPRFYSYAFGLGAGYRFDENLEGFDSTFRAYLLWPKVDMHMSAGARVSEFSVEGKRTIRVSPELRFGKSFGFAGFYLGISHDFSDDALSGRLERSVAIQSGVQLAIPWWRTKRWLGGMFGAGNDFRELGSQQIAAKFETSGGSH